MATASTNGSGAAQAPNVDDVAERILKLCNDYPSGFNDEFIIKNMPDVTTESRVSALNRLLTQKRINLLMKNNLPFYKRKDPTKQDVQFADNEEKVVYHIIEESGNKGIWYREIRYKSNLQLSEVTKILKKLESKELIKSVTSVAASKRKMYILANLEPDQSLTGGAFFTNNEFDTVLTELVNELCHKYLKGKETDAKAKTVDPMERYQWSSASCDEIRRHINGTGICKVSLSVADIERVMDTLVYDGKVEKRSEGSIDNPIKMYRCIKSVVSTTGLTRAPCGVCPRINECRVGGIISPFTCSYITKWLNGEEF